MNPTIRSAYLYLVALIALHMLVLGAANVLRVAVELVARVTTSTFLGLPFVFAEGVNRPGEVPREQLSLAIALVLVGGGAWWVHWRIAQRAALRDPVERGSAWRSFYLQLVLFVTALLVVFHGADALAKVVLGMLVGPSPAAEGRFGAYALEREWPARVLGILGMVVAAGAAWVYHARWSARDGESGTLGQKAISLRRVRVHALRAIALVLAATSGAGVVAWLWGVPAGPDAMFGPGGGPSDPQERRRISLGALSQPLPLLAAGVALWWNERRLDRRLAAATGTLAVEQAATGRATFRALTLLFLGLGALGAAASISAELLSRATGLGMGSVFLSLGFPIGTLIFSGGIWLLHWRSTRADLELPDQAPRSVWRSYLNVALALAGAIALVNGVLLLQRVLWSALDGTSLLGDRLVPGIFANVLAFSLGWAYHRRVRARLPLEGRETRWGQLARHIYTYGFTLAGVAMTAFGAAGAAGVAGSAVLGDNTHSSEETGLYLALALLGALAWWIHWRDAQEAVERLGHEERRARLRRAALGLAVLGGVAGSLAFGASAIFRLVNALLGAEVDTRLVHDLWHLVVDVAAAAAVALFHVRALRADRAALGEEVDQATPGPATTVTARPLVITISSPAPGARERVLASLQPGESAEFREL